MTKHTQELSASNSTDDLTTQRAAMYAAWRRESALLDALGLCSATLGACGGPTARERDNAIAAARAALKAAGR